MQVRNAATPAFIFEAVIAVLTKLLFLPIDSTPVVLHMVRVKSRRFVVTSRDLFELTGYIRR
jgi:hypothetical protein